MARDESRYTGALAGARRRGLELRFAGTVAEGESHARDWRPDLLLVDIENFSSGWEPLIRALRSAIGSQTPVLLVVRGQVPEKEVPLIQQEGLVDFVTKPLHSPILEYRLSNLRRTRRTLAGGRSMPAVVFYLGVHFADGQEGPDVLLNFMSRLEGRAVELLKSAGGRLHRQSGGGLIALFRDEAEAGSRALRCALELRRTWDAARAEIQSTGHVAPQGGIGVCRGPVNIGRVVNAALRFDFYALGDPVLRASQLQALTRSSLVDILVDEGVRNAQAERFQFRSVRLERQAARIPPFFHLESERGT